MGGTSFVNGRIFGRFVDVADLYLKCVASFCMLCSMCLQGFTEAPILSIQVQPGCGNPVREA